jgi:hypothetical protein
VEAILSRVLLHPILREEHRLRVFENKVLRRIFGLKRDEVTEGWTIGGKSNAYRLLVGKLEGKNH